MCVCVPAAETPTLYRPRTNFRTRGMLPPIAGIDFTPIFGLMFLNWASGVLEMGGEMDPDESVMTAADAEVEAFESLNHFDDSVLENPEFLQDEEDLGTRY